MGPQTTRRALLGCAGLAAVALTAGAAPGCGNRSESATVARDRWSAAVAHWRKARAAFDASLDRFNVAEAGYYANRDDITMAAYRQAEEDEQHFSRLDDEAMKRLIATPAPDLRALALKLELIDGHQLEMAPAIADVLRFAGRA